MKVLILSASLVALAACSNGEPLAACKGPVFQLNTGHWQPSPADLTTPRKVASNG